MSSKRNGDEIRELRERAASLEQEVARLQRVNDELTDRTLELYSLFELSYSLGAGVRYDRMSADSLDMLGDLLGIEQFSLLLFEPEVNALTIKAALGIPQEVRQKCVIRPGEGVAGVVFATGEAIYAPDVTQEPRYLYYKGLSFQGGSLLALPLVDEDNKPFGVLNISNPQTDAFSENQRARFSTLALQIAVIIQNYTFYRRLQHLSLTDELTGVANRRAFFEGLDEEHNRHRRSQKSYSLLLIDVDFFKRYNDAHGHLEGDRALRELAATLRSRCRSSDVFARYGGEEFVVCAIRTTKAEGLTLAEALREAAAVHNFELADGSHGSGLTITVGVASFPEDGDTSHDVLRNADRALYYGKSHGRNAVVAWPIPELAPLDGVGATGVIDAGRRGQGTA